MGIDCGECKHNGVCKDDPPCRDCINRDGKSDEDKTIELRFALSNEVCKEYCKYFGTMDIPELATKCAECPLMELI